MIKKFILLIIYNISVCDYQNKEVKDLSIRNWKCPNCYTKHERDLNAVINIMFKSLEKYVLNL